MFETYEANRLLEEERLRQVWQALRDVTALICRDGGQAAIDAGLARSTNPQDWVAFCQARLCDERVGGESIEKEK